MKRYIKSARTKVVDRSRGTVVPREKKPAKKRLTDADIEKIFRQAVDQSVFAGSDIEYLDILKVGHEFYRLAFNLSNTVSRLNHVLMYIDAKTVTVDDVVLDLNRFESDRIVLTEQDFNAAEQESRDCYKDAVAVISDLMSKYDCKGKLIKFTAFSRRYDIAIDFSKVLGYSCFDGRVVVPKSNMYLYVNTYGLSYWDPDRTYSENVNAITEAFDQEMTRLQDRIRPDKSNPEYIERFKGNFEDDLFNRLGGSSIPDLTASNLNIYYDPESEELAGELDVSAYGGQIDFTLQLDSDDLKTAYYTAQKIKKMIQYRAKKYGLR